MTSKKPRYAQSRHYYRKFGSQKAQKMGEPKPRKKKEKAAKREQPIVDYLSNRLGNRLFDYVGYKVDREKMSLKSHGHEYDR